MKKLILFLLFAAISVLANAKWIKSEFQNPTTTMILCGCHDVGENYYRDCENMKIKWNYKSVDDYKELINFLNELSIWQSEKAKIMYIDIQHPLDIYYPVIYRKVAD